MKTSTFYDRYHQKNAHFSGVISDSNFTYFYILRTLREACGLLGNSWKNKKVLDVGCGVGALSLYLGAQGAQVTGIDISKRAITIAKHAAKAGGLHNQVSFSLQELKKSTKASYDFVLCSEVIEHVPNDTDFLQKLLSHLKPGGVLMLTTPSQDNLLFNTGYYDTFDQEVGHLRRYTVESLEALVQRSFSLKKPVEIVYLSQVEGPLRNLLFTSKLGFLIRFLKGPLVPVFHWLDNLSASAFGASDLQLLIRRQKKVQ